MSKYDSACNEDNDKIKKYQTPDESTDSLRKRVWKLEENVFFFKEVRVQSVPQIDVMFDELERLRGSLKTWYLIVDLCETQQPSAEIRNYLRQKYLAMPPPSLVALVIGKNAILRLVVRFVAGRSLKVPYAVVETLEKALQSIREAKA